MKEITIGEHRIFYNYYGYFCFTDNLEDDIDAVLENEDYTQIRGKEIDSVINLLQQAKEIYNKGDI